MVRAAISLPLLVVGALLAGCEGTGPTATTSAPAASVDSVRLPKGAFPRFLTVAPDGVVWCGEATGESIARVTPYGTVEHVRVPGESNSPADVVNGPGGAVWFAGFQMIGRVTASGDLDGWGSAAGVGLPTAATSGPDDAVWYTNETVPPTISRISPTGEVTDHPIPPTGTPLTLLGITKGPDDALWFTESSATRGAVHAIGRMTVDGDYSRFPLSGTANDPHRITAGPDGALWFTLGSGAIGRVAVDGATSEFPLPDDARPFDITASPDGALWFSTDQASIGRITTSGEITLHPVEGAMRLIGIAAAPDGTLWVADGEADTLWHYTPTR